MKLKEIYAWRTYHKNDIELSGVDWNKLTKFIKFLNTFYKTLEGKERIEERPPQITENTFNPQGWVGTYFVGDYYIRVLPNPELLSRDKFKRMINEIAGWAEYAGPFIENFLRFSSFDSMFNLLLNVPYSRYLIEYTEILLSHFIPRSVSLKEYLGPELRGKPVWLSLIHI